jgi:ATP-binding cassette, subfamily B, bacterial
MNVSVYVWQVLQSVRWWLYAQCFVAIIWAIDLSFRPYLIKLVLDVLATTSPDLIYTDIWVPVFLYIGMSLIMVGVFRLYDYIALMVSPAIKQYVAETLVSTMMHHTHQFYQTNFAGSLGNKIKDTMTGMADLTKKIIDRFFSHGLAIIIACVTLWMVNIWFSCALIVWIIIFSGVSVLMARTAHTMSEATAASRSGLMGYVVDVLSAMMTVRLFNGVTQEKQNLAKRLRKYTSAERARDWYFLYLFTFQGISFVVYQALCLWWLVNGFKQGEITPGDFALVLSINSAIVDCLWYLVQDVGECAELYGSITQALRTILVGQDIIEAPDASTLVVSHGAIRFDHVNFKYKSHDVLFSDLSITIPAGQKVGLVGFSGSGKTTFVNLILRVFDVSGGAIYIDDQDIKLVTQESLRQAIGMIPQDPAFFNRSVMDNVRYGKHDATDEEIIAVAQKAHAHDFIMRMPQGYNAMVGERGVKLSGGQRQRLAIARAMLKNAPILILDEATSALDTITEQQIQEALHILMQGKTVLAIAHRLSTVQAMDRILVFDKGVIKEDGTHQELLDKGGLYAQLWSLQVGGILQDKKKITISSA